MEFGQEFHRQGSADCDLVPVNVRLTLDVCGSHSASHEQDSRSASGGVNCCNALTEPDTYSDEDHTKSEVRSQKSEIGSQEQKHKHKRKQIQI